MSSNNMEGFKYGGAVIAWACAWVYIGRVFDNQVTAWMFLLISLPMNIRIMFLLARHYIR